MYESKLIDAKNKQEKIIRIDNKKSMIIKSLGR